MNKRIFANGCSHMSGNYCTGTVENFDVWQERRSPASKLGKLLNVDDVVNYAKGGASNDRIYRTTIQFINDHYYNLHEYFFLIGWTSSDRSELTLLGDVNTNIIKQKTSAQIEQMTDWIIKQDINIVQTTSDDFGNIIDNKNNYLNDFWYNFSPLYGEIKKINYIIGLESLLKSLNVKYYFYNAIGTLPVRVTKLINESHFYKPFTDNGTEFKYLKKAGFKTNPICNHFDHDATEHWAEIIFNEIKKVYE